MQIERTFPQSHRARVSHGASQQNMKKKNEIGLAVLLAGIAAVAGWFILRAWVWVSEEIFGINLVENGEQVISDREIASYNRTSHEIRLTDEGVRKIEVL